MRKMLLGTNKSQKSALLTLQLLLSSKYVRIRDKYKPSGYRMIELREMQQLARLKFGFSLQKRSGRDQTAVGMVRAQIQSVPAQIRARQGCGR
jgi:hypothetical protein